MVTLSVPSKHCVLACLVLRLAACSTSPSAGSASTNPCGLLTPGDIEGVLGAHADPGQRVQAIGERQRRICSYRVAAPLRTVIVYLGHGTPRPPGRDIIESGATLARAGVYVMIDAQFPPRGFSPSAERLARIALNHAAPPDGRRQQAQTRHTFCARSPLYGQIGYDSDIHQFFGRIAGLPADRYVETRWLATGGSTTTPITETSGRTDTRGVATFAGTPSFISESTHVGSVTVFTGSSSKDAKRIGPPALPC